VPGGSELLATEHLGTRVSRLLLGIHDRSIQRVAQLSPCPGPHNNITLVRSYTPCRRQWRVCSSLTINAASESYPTDLAAPINLRSSICSDVAAFCIFQPVKYPSGVSLIRSSKRLLAACVGSCTLPGSEHVGSSDSRYLSRRRHTSLGHLTVTQMHGFSPGGGVSPRAFIYIAKRIASTLCFADFAKKHLSLIESPEPFR
jgi:hypothetical protein